MSSAARIECSFWMRSVPWQESRWILPGLSIYMVAGASGKCIQGFPGLSFVLVRKGFLRADAAPSPDGGCISTITQYVDDEGRGRFRFTPAMQVYYRSTKR